MKFFVYLISLGLICGFLWLSVDFFTYLKGASDGIKAASIAGIVSVFTFLVGRYLEQKRELRSKQNLEKARVYRNFFDIYFKVFTPHPDTVEDETNVWLVKEFIEFQKELVLWGSDSVMNAYIDFRIQISKLGIEKPDNSENSGEVLVPVMKSAAALLAAMRRDLGYTFTTFDAHDLGVLQLQHTDPDVVKLLEKLKRKSSI